MVAAIRALEALAHERAIAKLKLQNEEVLTPLDGPPYQLPYDPASVFLLETMISITCQAPQYIEEIWSVSRILVLSSRDTDTPLGQLSLSIYLPSFLRQHSTASF